MINDLLIPKNAKDEKKINIYSETA